MTLEAGTVTVGTSETVIYASTQNTVRVRIHDNGATDVYVGPTGVTTANGFPVPVDAELEVELRAGETLYGIVAAGTEDIRYIVLGTKPSWE